MRTRALIDHRQSWKTNGDIRRPDPAIWRVYKVALKAAHDADIPLVLFEVPLTEYVGEATKGLELRCAGICGNRDVEPLSDAELDYLAEFVRRAAITTGSAWVRAKRRLCVVW